MSKPPHEACNRTIKDLRASLAAAEAKLADERKHADAMYGGLVGDSIERTRMTVMHRARRAGATPSPDGSKEETR